MHEFASPETALKLVFVQPICVRRIEEMSGSEAKKPFERLPANVIPVNYALHVTPDLQQFTFTGTVSIDVQVMIQLLT